MKNGLVDFLKLTLIVALVWAPQRSLIAQSVPSKLIRLGDVARQLSGEDLAALALVLPKGAEVWLLTGDTSVLANTQYVGAYLLPTTVTSVLRRGSVVTVSRRTSPVTAWATLRTEAYAQVAIAGKTFEEIRGDQDNNQPFRIIGAFDDAELVPLIQFVRSTGSALPIVSVVRESGDTVRVMTRAAAGTGNAVTLRVSGKVWVVVSVGYWAA